MPLRKGLKAKSEAKAELKKTKAKIKKGSAKAKTSPFVKGYDKTNKEISKRSKAGKEIMFGKGKTAFSEDDELRIVFVEVDPLSYNAHNMFSVGKIGFLTCSEEEDCRLCESKIEKAFKSAWGVYLIKEDNSIEARYFARGVTEFKSLEQLIGLLKKRCSICGKKMNLRGGNYRCKAHPKNKGSKLTDWVFTLTKSGTGTSSKWNFDRDDLIDDDLRDDLNLVDKLDLEELLAPKGDKYLDKVLSDLDPDADDDDDDIEEDDLEDFDED